MGENRNEINPANPDVTTEKIREDIRRTEASISETLHSIEHRFTPRHIRNQLKAKMRYYAFLGLVKTNDAVRQRKVQAAVGAGAALMFVVRNARKHGRKTTGTAAKGAAVIEALPERIKRNPIKGIKHYLTVGRIALAVASAVGTVLFRGKAERAPRVRHPRQVPAMPHRVATGRMHGTVME